MTKAKRMEQMVGSPGTWSGMVLRVSQCVFAAASVCAMLTAFLFSESPAFFYLMDSPAMCFMGTMMPLQLVWSLGLACVDIYAMRNRKDLHERTFVFFLVVGDGIMALLTFTAACASAGVSTLFVWDVHFCTKVACGQIVLSIVLAFIAFLLVATYFFSMFGLHASFS
nr:CASP-like protein 5B3 [Lolium perenne]